MLKVREAIESDVEAIRSIFKATYGNCYTHPKFYDVHELKRMVYGDDTLMLVAEDAEANRVIGTASTVVQIGAYADLVGEFGRLAVHPDYRSRGCGHLLMAERIRRVESRLHLGMVENRCTHAYSQKISQSHGFVGLGFIPLKMQFDRRESIALYGRHFGNALSLRRNHPRIVPEVYPFAHLSLTNCGLPVDAIIEEEAAPYPHAEDYELEELTTEGYTRLLRIQRGRIKNREVFGPIRLHYGMFQLQARQSSYLIARKNGQVVGGIGYLVDEVEKAVKVFEVVSTDDLPIHFLYRELVQRCEYELGAAIIEVDVSAYSPQSQRTLIELGFVPVAYIPSMVFHEVERLDAVRMVRLMVPCELGDVEFYDQTQPFADAVVRSLAARDIQPRIAEALPKIPLFRGLAPAKALQVAAACGVRKFPAGDLIFRQGDYSDCTYLILAGEVRIHGGPEDEQIGTLGVGECLGESALLHEAPHSASATAQTDVEVAILAHADVRELIRIRPDVGVVIYRNLAAGLNQKLQRLNPSTYANRT